MIWLAAGRLLDWTWSFVEARLSSAEVIAAWSCLSVCTGRERLLVGGELGLGCAERLLRILELEIVLGDGVL